MSKSIADEQSYELDSNEEMRVAEKRACAFSYSSPNNQP